MRTTIVSATLILAAVPAMADIAGITTQPVNIPASAVATALDTSGNLWILDSKQNSVDRLTPSGAFTSYAIPTAQAQPLAIAAAPDGNLWFVETGVGAQPKGKVAKVTPSGSITEFPLPGTMTGGPWQIAVANDGSVWFLELIDGVHVGRLGTDGTFAEFRPAGAQFLAGIAPADVGVWLIDTNANMVWKMGTDGSIGISTTIATGPQYSGALGVTALDGTFWFIHGTNGIARIAPGGDEKEYAVPTANANPAGIAVGGDGNIWFSEYSANQIGQLIVSTADSNGHATINESPPIGAKLADIFFVPPSGGAAKTAPVPTVDNCDPPQGIVRKDDGTSGNLIRITFKAPSNCANLGIIGGVYQRERTDNAGGFFFNFNNAGKDDVSDGTLRITLYPDIRAASTALINCETLLSCPLQGSAFVCSSDVRIKNGQQCTGEVFLHPVPGLDDVIIVTMTLSSSVFDQDLSNNAAVSRIDTRASTATPLPRDSLTPVVTNPVKRGGH
jgi:virginiamycin B lyase